MTLSITDGWLTEALHIQSPNCDQRPEQSAVDAVVIHGISLPPGQYGGDWINALFTNTLDAAVHPYFAELKDLRVSAHVLIARDGTLTQYVSFDERAWHAGKSCLDGRDGCNDFSIGIELEGCDDDAYEDIQYQRLASLLTALRRHYPAIDQQRIVGHADIAPGRKTDPGPAFDWPKLRRLLDEQRMTGNSAA